MQCHHYADFLELLFIDVDSGPCQRFSLRFVSVAPLTLGVRCYHLVNPTLDSTN